jgi:uncharacterized protein YyaL (SSP411 family)
MGKTGEDDKGMDNHLANDKSPYLLQHARNPVDWYPWGEEAFEKSKKEDKPIFLSIGYATCHWCHVMAHESFEDEDVAALLNKDFVSIKVDREERPDIDQIYMTVCQAVTGSGGWPLSVFMTPEAKPFFAGTYFPKTSRMNMPGFVDIVSQIAKLWRDDRGKILDSGEKITTAIQPRPQATSEGEGLNLDTLERCYQHFAGSFDPQWGGFGSAPKFPTPHNLTFLLRWHKRRGDSKALNIVEKTLDAMRNGGMFDQIGFGFHRYSVDAKWLVPHFEKMLYDQALLAIAYTEAFQNTQNVRYAQVVREILSYVLRDMTAPEGGFYSAEDADSEGEEGTFYVWSPEEVKACLGNELGETFCRFYDITSSGNFENSKSIPHIHMSLEAFADREGLDAKGLESDLESARIKLFEAREKRVHPLKDDKILTAWNGLMIAAFAKGYQVLGDCTYLDAARNAAQFVLGKMRQRDGRLFRRYRENDVAYPGYLEDYAFLVWGLIELYEASFEIDYLEEAIAINTSMVDIFWDEDNGGLFYTGAGNESLIAQSKDAYDGAIPSGNSVAALNLLRLGRLTGDYELEKRADQVMGAFSQQIASHPFGFTQFLHALDFTVGPTQEIVIAGDPKGEATRAMIECVHGAFLPNKALLQKSEGPEGQRLAQVAPFVEPMSSSNHHPTCYLCEQFACEKPITDLETLKSTILGR